MEKIKMKNYRMTNASLCLLNDHLKDMVFTYFLSIRWAKIKINTKRKMAKEEKHWKVRNFDMTMFHKKEMKMRFSYLSCGGEIQMKRLLIIMFYKIDRKLKRRKCTKNTHSSIAWFSNLWMSYIIVCFCNFWTFQLWKATFEVLETRRKEDTIMRQIRRWSEKTCWHEKKE